MNKFLAPLALATTLAATQPQPVHAEYSYTEKPRSLEVPTVCNSDIAVKNANNRVFVLIQGYETGKNELTYCSRGEKKFSAKVATGAPKSDGGVYTPEGNFRVGVLDKHKVSKKYRAKMPNAVHVYQGIWIHYGNATDKKGNILKYPSHGCVRLGWNDSVAFFNAMKDAKSVNQKVEVIIQGTNPRTKKDGK